MNYCTSISADVTVHHYEIASQDIVDAFGKIPSRSHDKGDKRTRGSRSEYKDTYCRFVVAEERSSQPEEIIDLCLKPITAMLEKLDGFLSSGGSVWIIIKLHDPNFVQLNVDRQLISKLNDIGVSLSIENHFLNDRRHVRLG